MLAYAGFIVQHITTGTTPLANLSAHLADPWGARPPADAATVIIAAGVVDATAAAASAAATALKSPFNDDASVFCSQSPWWFICMPAGNNVVTNELARSDGGLSGLSFIN